MKKNYLILLMLLTGLLGFSQPITVNTTTHTVPQLIEDVLIDSPCALVSNITWRSGDAVGTRTGIGYFENTNPNFPLSSGVVMTTGAVGAVPGPNNTSLGDGNWAGDTQLLNYIQGLGIDPGLNNYFDATLIEFDFTPLTNNMSFNFMFASEEYGTFQCDYSDAFAFFLTDVTTGTVTNLAIVPGTTTPISVITIRDDDMNAGCASVNDAFFGRNNEGANAGSAAINFNGQTVVMTASSAVIPNNPYRIKLVIADRNDSSFNSAVFIEAGSFNVGVAEITYPLGVDISNVDITEANGTALCPGQTIELNTGLDPAEYNFVWTIDGAVQVGQTGATIIADQPGEYCVSASNISGSSCVQTDCIIVEYLDGFTINQTPDPMVRCAAPVDLSEHIPEILDGLDPNLYEVFFYLTPENANNAIGQISSTYNPVNPVTTIYVRVENLFFSCPALTSFQLIIDSTVCPPECELDLASLSETTSQVVCINTPINDIIYAYGGDATGYTITGLPTGVSATEASGVVTISGVPSVTGVFPYTISTVGCGTELSLSGTITVRDIPVFNALSSNSPICEGEDAIFTIEASPNTTVLYSINGGTDQTTTTDASGVATVTVTGATANQTIVLTEIAVGTCSESINETATVIVNPNPEVTLVTTNSPICEDEDAIFTIEGTPNATITYTVNAGATQTATTDASGIATITIAAATADQTLTLSLIEDVNCDTV
ncbi:MAG: choice-of-anchor L domain-containing protein, partial [Flavobacterium sp.]|nr:choice-of-anchor L domain-containing protein [Flavobacterium sp.]